MLVTTCLCWYLPSGAAEAEQTAVDQIDRSYEIPITNPVDHREFPSVLLFESATLDTNDPDGSGVNAPTGEIYLSVQMTSGPTQAQFNDANGWPSYFAGITALPGSSLRYDAASGHHYFATEINPVNWTDVMDSETIDGLVDATYYFTVPITNRKGTLVILPSHTVGNEVLHFETGPLISINVGGPTKIPLSFPKNLTVITSGTAKKATLPAARNVASIFNFASTLIVILFALWIYRKVQRWRRRRVRFERAAYVVRETPTVSTATRTTHTERPVPASTNVNAPVYSPPVTPSSALVPDQPVTTVAAKPTSSHSSDQSTLRVDVLGPLKLSPTFAQPGESVKAIVTFLALNPDRVLTLDEIQTAIWPLVDGVNDIKRPVMLNYMAEARKVVGEHHLPVASGKSGYRLVDVTTDWAQFQQLVNKDSSASKDEAVALRRRALRLVRGVPFAGENSRYFTWALTPQVTYKIVDAITSLAHDLAKQSVLSGDLVGADEALRQGLLGDPSSLVLWEDLTDVMLESPDATKLHFHWRAAEQVLSPKDVQALRARELG
jgi:hypothetical protein